MVAAIPVSDQTWLALASPAERTARQRTGNHARPGVRPGPIPCPTRVSGMPYDDAVRELAAAYGVAVDYWDWRGQHVLVPTATMLRVLSALDVDASTPESAQAALAARHDAAWRRMLPPVLVTRQGWQSTFDVHVPEGSAVEVWLELETGEHR